MAPYLANRRSRAARTASPSGAAAAASARIMVHMDMVDREYDLRERGRCHTALTRVSHARAGATAGRGGE